MTAPAPTTPGSPVRVISQWFIKPGAEPQAAAALAALAAEVLATEPDTLTYLVHTAAAGDPASQSFPPAAPGLVVFYEAYRDAAALTRHLNGPAFTGFVREHGALFVALNGQPYLTAQFLTLLAGADRAPASPAGTAAPADCAEGTGAPGGRST